MASKKSKKTRSDRNAHSRSRRTSKKKRFNMDVTAAELRAIKKAANARGWSASTWVRTTLQEAIDAA